MGQWDGGLETWYWGMGRQLVGVGYEFFVGIGEWGLGMGPS